MRQIANGVHNLGLWPRLALTITLGFLFFFVIFGLLSMRIVSDSTQRILKERQVLTEMAADETDALLTQAFYELEKASTFARFDPGAGNLRDEYHMLAHAYGQVGAFSLGVYFLDAKGEVVMVEPYDAGAVGADHSVKEHIRQVMTTGQRSVSVPFMEPRLGAPAVALTIPILDEQGHLMSMLSGLIDLSSPIFRRPIQAALQLGHTGHAEIVDDQGMVIASTIPDMFLKPGEHVEWYQRMMAEKRSSVETVPYEEENGSTEWMHVMAFAPLSGADWGISVGGDAQETFAPVVDLRNSIILLGAITLAGILSATLIGARRLVRPVRVLTGAAQGIAEGNLSAAIKLSEGGEIGLLGQSLEDMRLRLKESMERIQGWNVELEEKVRERTKELEQLAWELQAASAVATAANESVGLPQVVDHCLDTVMHIVGAEASAVALLDRPGGRLTTGTHRWPEDGPQDEWGNQLPAECLGHQVLATGEPLIGGGPVGGERGDGAGCPASGWTSLAVIPLRTAEGINGTLCLASSRAGAFGTREVAVLTIIGHQLGIAIEKARLMGEVSQLQAMREVDLLKSEFISGISHEIRTPLGFIKGYTTTLLRSDVQHSEETRREFLQIVGEETEKLTELVENLLDTSRIEAGSFTIERRPMDIEEVVRRVVEKVQSITERHSFSVTFGQPLPAVPGDSRRIEQVLHNLLDNAIKYSPRGAGSPSWARCRMTIS
ncbi:MAG: histidine kinase dimerization/phospho-acceptor domain-containing protein [Dehalococcoidia bacterium]